MILYHAITTYHILRFAVHKLVNHRDEDAILLIPAFLVREPSGLQSGSIFSKVIKFRWEREINGLTEKAVLQYVGKQLKEYLPGMDIRTFTEINVASAAYLFGSWLFEQQIPYNWFEEADGRFSYPEPIMQDDARIAPMRYQLAAARGAYTGDTPYVQKKYMKFSSQKPGFEDPLAVNFSVTEEMQKLNEQDKETLLDFFDVPRDFRILPGSALMLTQHFANLRVLTYAEHILCYQLTTDYYLGDWNLYYKWHPSDVMAYPSFIENVHMIPGQFPSELLPLVCEKPFEIGASISSTGIRNIDTLCRRILLFDETYLASFQYNHQYYFCIKLMELFPEYPIISLDMNLLQLKNMAEFSGVSVKPTFLDAHNALADPDQSLAQRPHICLASTCMGQDMDLMREIRESLHPDSIYVFLDLEQTGSFLVLADALGKPIVKEIEISALEPDLYGQEKGKLYVYIFVENENSRRKIQTMKYVKKLIHTGIETAVFPQEDKDLRILILKGMLKATENQLQVLQKENEELKRKK